MGREALADFPDERLVEDFRATENNAYFEELIARHRRSVFSCCFRVLDNASEAEEVAQETFLTVFRKIHLYRGGTFQPWLSTIARRLALNCLKKRLARLETVAMEQAAPLAFLPDGAAAAALTQEVRLILDQLSAPQRICVKLFCLDGYTYKEIERLTGFSGGEVKSYIQNGKLRFRAAWEKLQAARK